MVCDTPDVRPEMTSMAKGTYPPPFCPSFMLMDFKKVA